MEYPEVDFVQNPGWNFTATTGLTNILGVDGLVCFLVFWFFGFLVFWFFGFFFFWVLERPIDPPTHKV